MNHPPKTGKRLVSKGEYVQVQLLRLRLWLVVVLAVGACAAFLCASLEGFALIYRGIVHHRFLSWFAGVVVAATYAATSVTLGVTGRAVLSKAFGSIELVVPITRANIADLPTPDSLVRASEEPSQEKQTVLLRATQGQETPPEQLVRPAVGQEPL